MAADIQLQEVRTRRDLKAFVRFPWQVYRGDRNWVPPLISERVAYLTPGKNPLLRNADMALFLARRQGRVVGTIGTLLDKRTDHRIGDGAGIFGFFEVIDDYSVAERLLDAARAWARERGATLLRGPQSFSDLEYPGVLIDGADCPPVVLAGHTPPYYREFLERYGMEKYDDVYAWRAFRSQIGEGLKHIPEEIKRAAEAAERQGFTVRKGRLDRWAEEVATAGKLFNVTLNHFAWHEPVSEDDFRRLADAMRPIVDPDLALFAEIDGRVAGFCVSLPDMNRILIHLNGRLFPLGWLRLWWYARRVDVLTFKLMGVLPEVRFRGVDALLFLESLRAMMAKHYQWLDGSLASERNAMVNLMAGRFGAERYKHYRIYQMAV
jgi:GNAT superfamily N-acetyltransferase